MHDPFSAQLSAYLDGELERPARRQLEAHLAECEACAALLGDLRRIAAAAPHYEGQAPARDLWPAIQARMAERQADVVPIGTLLAGRTRRAARFGWPALIAASLLMAAVGGGATWLALQSTRLETPAELATGFPADSAKTFAFAEAQYDAAVRDLEQLLEAGRSRLDSTTVRTIELSLQRIDAAIEEAHAAIQRDPSNAYLSLQIAANMRRKLALLRTATNAIAART